jgi:2-dehydro-3-deoxygluconokinase
MTKIACIGECMIELTQGANNGLSRGYGGDTLNTAIYLSRLGAMVDYITALGDDPFSDEMIAGWRSEGVGTERVVRIAGKLPGLYAIRTSDAGERSFYYWRESAAARMLLDLPETGALLDALASYDLIYLSGITLSLYSEAGRSHLAAALARARAGKTRVAFDTNFRARGWPVLEIARSAYRDVLDVADIALASVDDLSPLYGVQTSAGMMDRLATAEIVLKLSEPACIIRANGTDVRIAARPVANVVDTTAAGDSFSAAYLAARLEGAAPVEAALVGHRLAGAVVGHRGAIIPRNAMPPDILPGQTLKERS